MADCTLVTDPISDGDAAADFDCSTPELNTFFASRAFQNDRRGIGKTFVLRRGEDEGDLPPIIGLYTLSMAGLEGGKLPRRHRENLPKYPLPVALIGRLAVDKRAKGRGYGDVLMGDAFTRVLTAAKTIGCFGHCRREGQERRGLLSTVRLRLARRVGQVSEADVSGATRDSDG